MNTQQDIQEILNADLSQLEELATRYSYLLTFTQEVRKKQVAELLAKKSQPAQPAKPKAKPKVKRNYKRSSPDDKNLAIDMLKRGVHPKAIATRIGINISTVYSYKAQLKKKGELDNGNEIQQTIFGESDSDIEGTS